MTTSTASNFVASILTDETIKAIKSWSESVTRSEPYMNKCADLFYANGGRSEMLSKKKTTGEAEAVRLEMVRQWDMAFISGFSKVQRDALAHDKKSVPAECKVDREKAQDKLAVYRGRFIKAIQKLEPQVIAPESSEGEGEGETDKTSTKTPTEKVIARLTDALKYLRDMEQADYDLVATIADVDRALTRIVQAGKPAEVEPEEVEPTTLSEPEEIEGDDITSEIVAFLKAI